MSGTLIPLGAQPFDPFIGNQKELANEATQAGIGQTQAQTSLLGEQARTAQIGNLIQGARLPFLMKAYGGGTATGIGGGQPGGGGGAGPPGAIGASGGQDWTGPNGVIPDPELFGYMGAIPKGKYTELILSPAEKWADMTPKILDEKNRYINQAVAGTLDPQTGQADPTRWNQMIQKEVNDGWMTASQARELWDHPQMFQTLLNKTLPVNEMPGTKQAQAGAEAGGRAPYELVDVSVTNRDGTTQMMKVPKSALVGGQGQGGQGGQGALPADLSTNIHKAAAVYSVPENDLTAMARIESGGRSNATSPTGAAGVFQFTGGTANDMGVTNPRDNRQAALGAARLYVENRAELNDKLGRAPASSEIYLAHQQGADGAAALIKAPPGMLAVDALKQAGIPPRNVLVNGGTPTMTAGEFVDKWRDAWGKAGGGSTQVAGPGAPTQPNPNAPVQIPPTGQAQPLPGGAVAAAEPPKFTAGVEAARAVDTKHIGEDDTTNQANLDAAHKSTLATVGVLEGRELVKHVPAGAFIDQRMAIQSALQQTGNPLLARISTALTGLSPQQLNDAEFARKLYQNNVVAQEQAIGGARIGAMLTNFYAKASPNLSLQNGALEEMSNAALVGGQMVRDFANGGNEYVEKAQGDYQQKLASGHYETYKPMRAYEGTWTAPASVHSADTYAAAAHLLNGASMTEITKGLTVPQIYEAFHVIGRADPGAMAGLLARPDVDAWRDSVMPGRKKQAAQ